MATVSVKPTPQDSWWMEAPLADANAAADQRAASLTRNDPTPHMAPRAVPVPSTSRVWGDQEAEAAGLYETPNQGGDWWASAPLAQTDTVEARSEVQAPAANADALRAGLRARATEMTRGPAVEPGVQMLADFQNQAIAGGQGTTPFMQAQMPNLVSTEVHESDAGFAMYRDPETGQMKEVDRGAQVVLRDPSDNRLKVFARSPETDEGALDSGARILSSGLAAGAPTARPAIPVAKSIQPRASEIFATAKPYYRAFKDEAGRMFMAPEMAADFGNRIRDALNNANFIPELAQPVYSALRILDSEAPLSLDVLQNLKRVVGRSFNSPDKNIRDAASVASREIGIILREAAPNAAQNLKTGDAIHSTARSVQDLQRKSEVANLRAGRAGYGGNAINSMRQVLSPIVQRAIEGKTTSFKPNEIQAMRDIVEGTGTTNALRGAGQLSPSKGIIQTVGAGGATAFLGPAALAIPAIGAASNKLATVLTGKQIERLKELVAKRSPAYAEAVRKATERYERTQLELVNDPSPNRFAAYLSASRALSSGLNRDGVQVASGELLRAIQGPMKSAAENEQPEPVGVINQ